MKKSILVTGSHRSGSTWIGKVICNANGVRYVSEPFNLLGHKKYTPFKYWFYFINNKSSKEKQIIAKKYIDSFYNYSISSIIRDVIQVRSFKPLINLINDYRRRVTDRTLLKDPIALFSAEWLAEKYNCDVIISVRHPAAFVASLKVKDWQFDFNNFLNQKELMETHLSEYASEIELYANNRPDIIKQGVLLWNIIYSTVSKYQNKYDDWYFVKHEDLSLNPIEEYRKIFKYLKLEFSEKVQNELLASTNAKESSNLKRNSAENISSWKKRLSDDEIKYIKEKTQLVCGKFYNESSWN